MSADPRDKASIHFFRSDSSFSSKSSLYSLCTGVVDGDGCSKETEGRVTDVGDGFSCKGELWVAGLAS